MKTSIKRITLSLLCVPLVAVLVGCNTVHGMGEDIQKSGEWIQHSASGST